MNASSLVEHSLLARAIHFTHISTLRCWDHGLNSTRLMFILLPCQTACPTYVARDWLNENHFSRDSKGFNHDAGKFAPSPYRVDPHTCRKIQAEPSCHCQTVTESVRTHGSCSNIIPSDLLYTWPLQWWLKSTQNGFPRGATHLLYLLHADNYIPL